MTARGVLFTLLGVVATAAAVLSFAALRDLAQLCGFAPRLAWLLPVVVDAGAAAGSLVWLGGTAAGPARRFARSLALSLLALSVLANAVGHGLAAFELAPAWWVVVIVSAVAPAVLGAVVHLAVLVGRPRSVPARATGAASAETTPLLIGDDPADEDLGAEPELSDEQPDLQLVDERGLSLRWADAPSAEPADLSADDRARELIAAGAGRRRLARELDISEHTARLMLDEARGTTDVGDRSA